MVSPLDIVGPVMMGPSSSHTAGLIGRVVAGRASLSGAEGGCQAETGATAGITAGAGAELPGGNDWVS